MAKISVTKDQYDLEGDLYDGVVKPFGNSAHIVFSKEYIGRHVNIVVPTDEEYYCWIFSKEELKTFVTEGKKAIEKHIGKMKPYWLQGVERIKEDEFYEEDISAVCNALEKQGKCKELVKKVRKAYL